jgi:capsular polysaccharide transport system ATP-binding protein
MIELRNVSVRTRGTINPVFLKNINLRVEAGDRIGILGPKDGGLPLILDVICGANAPLSGSVNRTGRISWPIPGGAFFHKHQSYVANARFVARLYEVDQHTYISRVLEMAEVGDLADLPVSRCPRAVTSRFAFALGACLSFETYVITNTNIGGKTDREKYQDILEELASRSGLLIVSSSAKTAEPFCHKAYVLDPAGSVYYDDMEAAAEHLARVSKRGDASSDQAEAEEEEQLVDDFF